MRENKKKTRFSEKIKSTDTYRSSQWLIFIHQVLKFKKTYFFSLKIIKNIANYNDYEYFDAT